MKRTLIYIAIVALSAFASEYGVLSVCTKTGGDEYCHTKESVYSVVSVEGHMVIANGFHIARYELTGKDTLLDNGRGGKVKHNRVSDEKGYPYLLFESRDNLWLADTTGCVTLKYLKGNAETFRKRYTYREVNSAELTRLATKCRDERK